MTYSTSRGQMVREALEKRGRFDTGRRLEPEDVDRIVDAFIAEPTISFAELGRRFGVTPQTIRHHIQKATG
jgi:transposase-like protein